MLYVFFVCMSNACVYTVCCMSVLRLHVLCIVCVSHAHVLCVVRACVTCECILPMFHECAARA